MRRIQNKSLFHAYEIKRLDIKARYPDETIEEQLWHGTSADAVQNINHQGFNRSFCGKNGKVLHIHIAIINIHITTSSLDHYMPCYFMDYIW